MRAWRAVGPHADRVLTDWYSGTPPYTVSIAAEALAPVDVVTGADTVALRSSTTGAYVDAGADGILAATAGSAAHHDLTDWGEGVLTLRAAATGLLWTGGGWILRADDRACTGWARQESFRAHGHDDGSVSLQHLVGWWAVVEQATGGVRPTPRPPRRPSGSPSAPCSFLRDPHGVVDAEEADVGRVGNYRHLLVCETEDRPHLRLPESQAELGRAVLEAIMVVVSSYPYVLGTLGDDAAAVVDASTSAKEPGTPWRTC